MATQLQLRRGTTSETGSFTGAVGEVTVDTTKDTLVVHDGSTAGGHEVAKNDGSNMTAIDVGDNVRMKMGNDDDLLIYHDGSNSRVQDSGTGSLLLRGTNLKLQDSDGYDYVACEDGGGEGGTVKLKHNNQQVFATTTSGVDVTGNVTADGMTISGTAFAGMNIQAGASSLAAIDFGDSADSNIGGINYNNADDTLNLRSGNANRLTIAADGSLSTPTLGTSNVRFGANAGKLIASGGIRNVVIGDEAGTAITTGDSNVAVGYEALKNEDDHGTNTALGTQTLFSQNAGVDAYNTAVGFQAGGSVSTGIKNTLIGGLAGDALQDADENVAIGYAALTFDTLGSRSVAIGREALTTQNFTSATIAYNTAVGANAGQAVSTGIKNTFIGALAGDATQTGEENVAVGYQSLSGINGDANTACGSLALSTVTGGSNTGLGRAAGFQITGGSNNIAIGLDALRTGSPGGAQTTASNKIGLGDENITSAHIQVDWTVASDARDKTDFTALDLGLDFVKDLQPVTYKWDKRSKYGDKSADGYDLNAQTPDGTHKEDWLDIGFKAQEVEALEIAAGYNKDNNTNLVSSHTDDGKQMGLQYSKFVPILVKAIQEQQALIESLTARIETLEG
jgi:hypothetical protein